MRRGAIRSRLPSALLDEALIMKMLRRPTNRSMDWACWNGSWYNLTAAWKIGCRVCECGCRCRRGGRDLAVQLLLEVGHHCRRKSVSFIPDLNQVGQLVLLIGRHVLDGIVEECRHQLGHSLDGCRVATDLSAPFYLHVLSTLFSLFDPFAHDTIDNVNGSEFVGGMSLFEGAIERLDDLGFRL